ncbi:MAG: DUF1573 domain-containing protein [Chitinophagaceae bacterium]|nr:DUF1573 domain-containing protein [Chitinophagaceae bacterium]
MKKYFFIPLFIFISMNGKTQNENTDTVFSFKKSTHDFGNIPQGKPVYTIFEITNISQSPVQIDNVQVSCGCTSPEWSRDPVAPGETTKLKVGYNAAAEGPFEKTITVIYGNTSKILVIKGNVWKPPAGSAPPNTAVDFLKKIRF